MNVENNKFLSQFSN